MRSPRFVYKAGLCLGLFAGLTALAGPVPSSGKPANYPVWWFERDLIARLPAAATKPNPVWPGDYPAADDFATANIGQLKSVVILAAAELDSRLPGGKGPAINQLLSVWFTAPAVGTPRDDYAALNQGQLKAVAKLFYDRLATLPYTSAPLASGMTYPWTASTGDDDAYAMVNLGQLKYMFSFQLPPMVPPADTDGDGLADAWELAHWSSLTTATGSGDPDGDGLSNLAEQRAGMDPLVSEAQLTAGTLSLRIFTP